ncbi:immunoglobulin lambda light chain variable region, partial [Pectobacterium versatile]|uniref:immunoglobulin lambda light chain variable region n=1 Tax=Pectobacterium versatile TaxID=2488639 RepID=UPI001F462506
YTILITVSLQGFTILLTGFVSSILQAVQSIPTISLNAYSFSIIELNSCTSSQQYYCWYQHKSRHRPPLLIFI